MANQLLTTLPAQESSAIRHFLTYVDLPEKTLIYQPSVAMTKLYFLESGMASVVTPGKQTVEVGIVGREGFLGWPVLLGTMSHPYRTFMQVAGSALVLQTEDLPEAIQLAPGLDIMFKRYIHAHMVQTAQTAVCNAVHPVRQRLARWLLMALDRSDGKLLPLTHEYLAYMLSVRRPSVGDAMQLLEESGGVHQGHGKIIVVDRYKITRTELWML